MVRREGLRLWAHAIEASAMISRHVCSLEMSRRLAEAGFPQECVFAWWEYPGAVGVWVPTLRSRIGRIDTAPAAPMLSEIMEQMPGMRVQVEYTSEAGTWWNAAFGTRGESRTGRSGPDAAGALWLALRGEK